MTVPITHNPKRFVILRTHLSVSLIVLRDVIDQTCRLETPSHTVGLLYNTHQSSLVGRTSSLVGEIADPPGRGKTVGGTLWDFTPGMEEHFLMKTFFLPLDYITWMSTARIRIWRTPKTTLEDCAWIQHKSISIHVFFYNRRQNS